MNQPTKDVGFIWQLGASIDTECEWFVGCWSLENAHNLLIAGRDFDKFAKKADHYEKVLKLIASCECETRMIENCECVTCAARAALRTKFDG